MSMRHLVAAATLAAAAAPAFAVIQYNNPTTFANENLGEFTFVAWSNNAQASYTLDLGFNLGDFLTKSAQLGSTSFNVTSEFSSHAALASATDLQWAVFYLDAQRNGVWGPGEHRFYTTINVATDPSNYYGSDDLLYSTQSVLDAFIGQTNNVPSHSTTANGSNYATPSDGDAYWIGGPNGNMGGWLPYNQGNAVNTASGFYFFTGADPDFTDIHSAAVTLPGTWSFNGATVSYVVSVPEADTAAMLAAGLCAIVLISRRRMR